MGQELPHWLDATFLERALQGENTGEPLLKVNKFSTALAVTTGDNYSSRLYRVQVSYNVGEEEKSTSLIVKAPLTKGIFTELEDLFGKEHNVYNHVLPKLNSLTNFEFGPKSLQCSEHNVLVLADLKVQGYVMCDRYKQLDFPHCEQTVRTLAKFHAASVACKRDRADLIDIVGKESLYMENEKFVVGKRIWIKETVNTVAECADELGLEQTVVNMLLNRSHTIADSVYRLCKSKINGLNVLNHGDLWINNILFKHSITGVIDDVKFIDFQITRYASPVLDLITFFWTSANEDVRESGLLELSEIYRLTLNSTLESLGCEERLTETKLQEDFKEAIDWAVIVICWLLPLIVSDTDDVINFEEFKYDDFTEIDRDEDRIYEKYLRVCKGKHYRALLPKLLEHLMNWVVLLQ